MASATPGGYRMPAGIGPADASLAASGKRFKIAGYVIGAFVLVIMPYLAVENVAKEGGSTGDMIGYIALGYGCGLPLFAGLPWLVGFTRDKQARQCLYLNGTQLTVVGLVGAARANVFDLSRTRMRLELVGGQRSDNATQQLAEGKRTLVANRDNQINRSPLAGVNLGPLPAQYFVPFHPVLILFREDDFQIPVELCHVASRHMRDPRETMMLAEAIRYNPDPAAQYVAGQLRTIARWRWLPHITAAQPHAVPATPVDYPMTAPVIPTPVQAGQPSPEIQIQP